MKPTPVLLHGYSADASVWSGFVPFLQTEYYVVIAPNYLEETQAESIDEYAEWLHGLLLQKGIRQCSIIGHSMGGYVALAFAEKYPEMMQSLGLFHSTAFEDSEERKALRLKNVEFLEKHGSELFIKNFIPNLYAEEFAQHNPEVIEKHIEQASKTPVNLLIAGMNAMRTRPDRRHILEQANYPILFIIGMQDKSVPPKDCIAQTKMTKKQPQLELIQEIAHLGMVEEPFLTLQAVRLFLREVYR
jgi:pimeloyl-ACP methyl ester carboxylesterase